MALAVLLHIHFINLSPHVLLFFRGVILLEFESALSLKEEDNACLQLLLLVVFIPLFELLPLYWVAEWLACWTQALYCLSSKSQPLPYRVTVLGKLFTPIEPLFIKQQNW